MIMIPNVPSATGNEGEYHETSTLQNSFHDRQMTNPFKFSSSSSSSLLSLSSPRKSKLWIYFCLMVASTAVPKTNSASPVVIELSTELNVFSVEQPLTPYFRHLSVDPRNGSRMYVGGLDFFYSIDAVQIFKVLGKSPNMSKEHESFVSKNKEMCRPPEENQDYMCLNHVRLVSPYKEGQLIVCTTGAGNPVLYYVNETTLTVIKTDRGKGHCPYEPLSNFTFIYTDKGLPRNSSATYSGTMFDFSNSDSILLRPPIQLKDGDELHLLRSNDDTLWIYNANFVGSFDIGEFIYFFFREFSVEAVGVEKEVFSRVGRVCKMDMGGGINKFRFTSFIKARLNCSVFSADMPFFFNEIYDVSYDVTQEIFYGLFNSMHEGVWGSAICSYSLKEINRVFQTSTFKARESVAHMWAKVSPTAIPKHRPGTCINDTKHLASNDIKFAQDHPLVYDMVSPLLDSPVWMTRDDMALNQIEIDSRPYPYVVHYLSSSRGSIHRIVSWQGNGQHHHVMSAILLPVRTLYRPIWQLLLYKPPPPNKVIYLYLTTDDLVMQLDVQLCSNHVRCTTCSSDPYCGWNVESSICMPYTNSSKLLRDLERSADETCFQSCPSKLKHFATSRSVTPGLPIHLNCSSPCLASPSLTRNAKVTWQFSDSQSARMVRNDNTEYVISQDFSLILPEVMNHHNGTFSCSINNVMVVRHHLSVLPCAIGRDKEVTWRNEFSRWCEAYQAYTTEYKYWSCLMNQCIKESCLPTKIINQCSSLKNSKSVGFNDPP